MTSSMKTFRIPKKNDVVKRKMIQKLTLTKEEDTVRVQMIADAFSNLLKKKREKRRLSFKKRKPFRRLMMLMRLAEDELVLEPGQIYEG